MNSDGRAVSLATAVGGSNDWSSAFHARSSAEQLMDALSDVLRAVRLKGAIFFDVHASDPWAAETPAADQIVGRMFPAAENLICYHAITHGTCWAAVANEAPLLLEAGDVVVIPHGHPHVLS